MAREGVTYEQVSTVIDRLIKAERNPTLRGIRGELGTGSMGTIQAHLARWKEEHRQVKAAADGIPAKLQQVILDEIGKAVQEARAGLEQQLVDAQDAIDDLSKENETLETDLAEQRRRYQEAEGLLAAERGRGEQLEKETKETERRAVTAGKAAESARIETAELRLRLEGLADLNEETKAMKKGVENLNAKLREAEVSAAAEKVRADAAEKAVAVSEKQIIKLEQVAVEQSQLAEKLRKQLKEAEQTTAEAGKEAAASTAVVEGLNAQMKTLEKIAEAAEKRLAVAEKKE